MHPCLGNRLTIGRWVAYPVWVAHAFSAGIECRHCSRVVQGVAADSSLSLTTVLVQSRSGYVSRFLLSSGLGSGFPRAIGFTPPLTTTCRSSHN